MTARATDATAAAAAARRRAALAKRMGDGVAVVVAGEESKTENQRPFRQDPRFLYLTGFSEPQAALILRAQGGKIARLIFLCRAKDAAAERWDGRRAGPTAAARMLEADEAIEFSWEALGRSLESESDKSETLYFLPGDDARIDKIVMRLAARRRRLNRAGFRPLAALADLAQIVDAMRAIKDESEIAAMRIAAQIAVAAHKDAMRAALRAKFEREIEAALIARYRAEGAHHAFAPIVAAGANACVLHYTANDAPVRGRDLILVDSGCEYRGYASDITRAFPARGKFSSAQKDACEAVLEAQQKALAQVKAGALWRTVEDAAARALAAGLRRLGVLRGQARSIVARGELRRFYMHRVGHLLGMDVHDVGELRVLAAGSVVTIEPGLYFAAARDVPARLRGIGIRIEDDVVARENGAEILTADAPKTPAAIEEWMRA